MKQSLTIKSFSMVVLDPGLIIGLVVIVVVVVIIVVIVVVCCLCRKCEQCAKFSRRKALARQEAEHERQVTEHRRHHEEVHQEREKVRNEIRAKYNLNGYNDRAATTGTVPT